MSPPSPEGLRVAFFGGSFDPPHCGHLAVARAARQALSLDKVLFAPVGLQPLKRGGSSASFQHRVAMTRLAIARHPDFELCLLDAPSQKPNYTVDTLAELAQTLPAASTLYLLIGADSFRAFRHWHRAAEIPFLAILVVAARPGEDLANLDALLPRGLTLHAIPNQPDHHVIRNPRGQQSELILLPDLNYDISATNLRHQIHGHLSANPSTTDPQSPTPPLIDPKVLQYIHQHHLYESPTSAS